MAQIDTQTTALDGTEYEVAPLDPLVANDILVDILKVVGPALGAMDDGASDTMVEGSFRGLFERLDKAKLREIISILAKVTSVNLPGGESPQLPAIFTLHFRGKLGLMYRWLGFALRVQFGDFFDSAAPAIARLVDLARAAQGSASPIELPDDGT